MSFISVSAGKTVVAVVAALLKAEIDDDKDDVESAIL